MTSRRDLRADIRAEVEACLAESRLVDRIADAVLRRVAAAIPAPEEPAPPTAAPAAPKARPLCSVAGPECTGASAVVACGHDDCPHREARCEAHGGQEGAAEEAIRKHRLSHLRHRGMVDWTGHQSRLADTPVARTREILATRARTLSPEEIAAIERERANPARRLNPPSKPAASPARGAGNVREF